MIHSPKLQFFWRPGYPDARSLTRCAAIGGLILSLTGCTESSGDLKSENEQLKAKLAFMTTQDQTLQTKVADLQAENSRLQAQVKQGSTVPGATPAASSDRASPDAKSTNSEATSPASTNQASATAESTGATKASFSDIAGVTGEQDIRNLAAVGVLNRSAAKFNPDQPVSRAQYVCWLVSANNACFQGQPQNSIHLAQKSDNNTFVDVPPTHPAFPWIQGMANAGYVVGVDANHFAPNQPLSREQMIAIKAQVDEGGPIETDEGLRMFVHFGDKADINKIYLGAVHEDDSVRTTNNIARVWGSTKVLRPRKSVTRSEAAVSLSKIGSSSQRHASIAEVLKNASG